MDAARPSVFAGCEPIMPGSRGVAFAGLYPAGSRLGAGRNGPEPSWPRPLNGRRGAEAHQAQK